MCTPLATATDSLILLVSFCFRMPVHPWMFWACLMVWIVLHYCFDFYVASPLLPTMSTSYCHSLHLPISLCCYCIIALYCVFAYTPQSTVSTGLYLFSSPICLLVIVFLLQEGRFILYCYCVLLLACCHWHWHLLLIICLLPQLLRAVAPALTLILSFKLRQVWCLPPIVDWLSDDSDVASVAV